VNRYRVRYIRYTIKVNMAMGNYGLAAAYIGLLLKYAHSNTEKLRKELVTSAVGGTAILRCRWLSATAIAQGLTQ
jgi:hypothetical protein